MACGTRLFPCFLQTSLLLLLLCKHTELLPWDTDSGRGAAEACGDEDACGVCGGDGSSCLSFSGTLSLPMLSVGYHKILEIPSGAQRIRIQETEKTRNYLAVRTAAGGSVINGDWVIDSPGRFSAAGAELTYKRPNEIRSRAGESITSPGPTNQELHVFVIYQQPTAAVSYEYTLPRDPPDPLPPRLALVESHSLFPVSRVENTLNVPHPNQVPSDPVTPDTLPLYSWVVVRTSPCSVTCGSGSRHLFFSCLEQSSGTTAPDDLCAHTDRPAPQTEDCHMTPCPAFWDVGEWSECSKTCGPGLQSRQVICRQTQGLHGNLMGVVPPALCASTEMPETTSVCQLKICSQWNIRSDWTECSVPCGVGQRSRLVVCVDNLGDVVEDEECNVSMRPRSLQNCDRGVCSSSWFFSLWSQRCSVDCADGNRSRSVICMTSHTNSLPLDSCENQDKPVELTACDLGPCTGRSEWYTGPWGQCSSECGNGTQNRGVVCVIQNSGQSEVSLDEACSHLPRPQSAQSCFLKSCSAQWFMTEWSTCSRSCGGGFRVREVRCLRDDQTESLDCDISLQPNKQQSCNTQACTPQLDGSCRDMYYNCVVVLQARLCVYSYYRSTCCASCARLLQRDRLRVS